MSRSSYPLEAARSLRQSELDAAQLVLHAANDALGERERELDSAKADLVRHRDETRAVAAREAALDRDGRSAGEMLRAQAYLARRAQDEKALVASVDGAKRAVHDAERAVEGAREALAEARAQREAVERHRESWQAERDERAEARAEAEAEDVIAGRPRREG